jgi:ribonuclease HI
MIKAEIFVSGSATYFLATSSGSYGVVVTIDNERMYSSSGGAANTTNARMDLIAIIEGLSQVPENSDVVVFLANGYVLDTINKGWLTKWKKTAYKKKKHADLWQKIDELLLKLDNRVSFRYINPESRNEYYVLENWLNKSLIR